MAARTVSKGLALFSLGLGAVELFASGKLARQLGAEQRAGTVRGFGLREIASGLAILPAPAHSTRLWSRVVGDAVDLAALGGLLRGGNAKAKWVWGAIGAVIGVTIADVLTARAMDEVEDTDIGKVKTQDYEFVPDFEIAQPGDDGGQARVNFKPDAAGMLAN